MKNTTRFLALLFALVMVVCFAGCEKHDPNLDVLEYSLVATSAEELAAVEVYTNLQTLNLTGSTCYDAIMEYIATHPQVAVTYDVQISGTTYSPDLTSLALEAGSFDYQELLANLKYLPNMAELSLPCTDLTDEQIAELTAAYPNVAVSHTLVLNGQEIDPALDTLDLSAMDAAQIQDAIPTLSRLSNLQSIELMNANGESKLSKTDVKALMDAVPNAAVHYSFDLFGKTVSTTDERIEYVEVEIGNDGIPQIREALDILKACTYFKMDRCEVDNEVMAQLRNDYPNTKIVWRVFFAYFNCLTDVEMIHATSGLDDVNVEVLKYCNDVLYLDIGHNTDLANLSFVSHMPKLKIAIVVDCATPDVEAFGNCPDLEWLEIVNCHRVKDLSPLANCTKLKGLNISGAFGIKDLTPLLGLQNMERLYLGRNTLPDGQYETAKETLSNCWVTNTHTSASNVSLNYAIGWRLDEDGSRAEWYKQIREIFRYSDNFYNHYKNEE